MRKLVDRIADICLNHSRLILFIAAFLAVLALTATTMLKFDPDILNLVPQNNRQVNDFRRLLGQLGTIDYHIVVLDMPKGRDASEYDSLIEQIARGYEHSKLTNEVTYRVPNPLTYIDKVLPQAFLFLTPAELDEVAGKLSDQGIRDSVARSKALLQTPQAFALKDVVRYDPFNLLPIYLNKFKSAGSGFKVDFSSGYYLSTDHSTLLILTKPKRPAQDVPFGKLLLDEGDLIEKKALKDFATANPEVPLPTIQHTGGYTIAGSDAELIKSDAIANVLFSFFGVLLLFIYAFRRVASVAYAGLPMALALAMTFGTAAVVYGTLSSASAGFAALLAGLGIDFITVMYGRYVDERNRGVDMPTATRTMIHSTLPGVVIAAITTAGTFFAFLATDFRGMTQLGFLTGIGIMLFLLCVMFVLPALIIEGERKTKRAPKLYLHSFGSEHLISWSLRRPKMAIAVWIVFTLITGALATQVRFSDNIQDLRAKGNPGVKTQEKLTKKFGQSFDYMMYVVHGRTMDETIEKTYAATGDLSQLVADGTIASYQSIGTFLPPVAQQQAVIAKLRAGQSDIFNPDRIEKTFRAALEENGFRPETYEDYIPLVRQALQPAQPLTLESVQREGLSALTGRFVKKVADGYISVIYVYPAGGVWSRQVPAKLLVLEGKHPGSVLTGVNLVSEILRNIVKADAVRSTLIGFAAVFLLMVVSFRQLKMTALTFVPFMVGGCGMLGAMALLRLQFNFMNIFVGLMIIGVATDYAIYILQRYIESPEYFSINAAETGKAVVMAAITSIVGYGSFALSHYPGLRSIGYASFFGIGVSGLAAITLLPAILIIGTRSLPSRRKDEVSLLDLDHEQQRSGE